MWRRKLFSTVQLRRSSPASIAHLPVHLSPPTFRRSSPFSIYLEIRRSFDGERRGFLEDILLSSRSYSSQPAAESSVATCWSCNSPAQTSPFLVCASCRSVQPVDESVDYFQIFGLEKKYEIDGSNLDVKYKDWQKKLHPDLVHTKSEREKEYAAEQSARVIDAYRTLSYPLPRAIYALKLEGVNVDEEETVSEPELLNEILEIREAVEEATDSHALNQIRSQMEDKLRHWSNSFANAIRTGKLDDALVCVRRMKYYTRVNEEIVKKL